MPTKGITSESDDPTHYRRWNLPGRKPMKPIHRVRPTAALKRIVELAQHALDEPALSTKSLRVVLLDILENAKKAQPAAKP
jgi:hypothetical protein